MTIKKNLAWLAGVAALVLMLALVGCSPAQQDHTVTYSGWMLAGTDDDDVRASFEEKGCTGITKNEDGSWTVTMPGERYEAYVAECRDAVQKILDELAYSEDWPNVGGVEYDEDFSEVTITLKTGEETLSDIFAPVAVGLSACVYQEACDLPVSCHIVTVAPDGAQLSETTYPAAASE